MSWQSSHTALRPTPCREATAYLIDRPLIGLRAESNLVLPALGGRNG